MNFVRKRRKDHAGKVGLPVMGETQPSRKEIRLKEEKERKAGVRNKESRKERWDLNDSGQLAVAEGS